MNTAIYSRQKAQGYFDRLAVAKRKIMYEVFTTIFPPHTLSNILDVGVTADQSAESSNYFEKYFPDKQKIIALSNQDGAFLTKLYPGLVFHRGDAKALPYSDNSIDVVFSSAVIEHIGNTEQQKQMLAECYRVAKKGVFITTPNRWHPLEVHTMLPLIHWLPKKIHRTLLQKLGLNFYAQEDNLNLLEPSSLKKFCDAISVQNFAIKTLRTFGFVSNLMLVIKK